MGGSYSSYVSRRFYPTTSRMDEGPGYHPKGKRRISASSSSKEIARGLISLDVMTNAQNSLNRHAKKDGGLRMRYREQRPEGVSNYPRGSAGQQVITTSIHMPKCQLQSLEEDKYLIGAIQDNKLRTCSTQVGQGYLLFGIANAIREKFSSSKYSVD